MWCIEQAGLAEFLIGEGENLKEKSPVKLNLLILEASYNQGLQLSASYLPYIWVHGRNKFIMYSKLYKQLKFFVFGVFLNRFQNVFLLLLCFQNSSFLDPFSSGQRNQTIGSSNFLDHHIIWNAQHPTEDNAGDINYTGLQLISGYFCSL